MSIEIRWAFIWLFVGLFLLTTGCTVNRPMEITTVYPPVPNETVIELPRAELEAKCLETRDEETCRNVQGLTVVSLFELGETAEIYLADNMSPWQRACILNHERRHAMEGDFHPGERHGGCQ